MSINIYTCMLGLREPSVLMLTVSFLYPLRIFEQPRPQQSLRFTLNLLAPSISWICLNPPPLFFSGSTRHERVIFLNNEWVIRLTIYSAFKQLQDKKIFTSRHLTIYIFQKYIYHIPNNTQGTICTLCIVR